MMCNLSSRKIRDQIRCLVLVVFCLLSQNHRSGVSNANRVEGEDTEYDYATFDPESPHGSPYGGFSRVTSERLAALPLKLPYAADRLDQFQPYFFHARDSTGTAYCCRTYHEDELAHGTLANSMFESASNEIKSNEDNQSRQVGENRDALLTAHRANVHRDLSALEGLCAQFHHGWWSYEWCFGHRVSQFHVEIKKQDQTVSVESVTNLGQFRENTFALDKGNAGVAVDEEFVDGDICPDTGKPRRTQARLRCCSTASPSGGKGMVLFQGEPVESDLVHIQSVVESKKEVCSYIISICTPILCDAGSSQRERSGIAARNTRISSSQPINADDTGKLSISEILDLTFPPKKKKCIQFGTGMW